MVERVRLTCPRLHLRAGVRPHPTVVRLMSSPNTVRGSAVNRAPCTSRVASSVITARSVPSPRGGFWGAIQFALRSVLKSPC
jgi:hypothetical protein